MVRRLPPRNPFVYGRVLTAADAACARPPLEDRILETVRNDGRLALVGDRRMGKSSAVQRTLEAARVPMLRLNFHEVLDLADVVLRTLADIERYLQQRSPVSRRLAPWLREAGLEIRELRVALGGLELKAAVGLPAEHLKRIFGFIRDAAQRDPMALFIDELQDLRDRLPEAVGNAVLAIIRDEIQQMSRCPIFFAGSARDSFSLLFTSDGSPFFQQAVLVPVEPVADDVLQAFILKQFATGHGISAEAAALIRQVAGPSINDVQLLCYETWNEHRSEGRAASPATVGTALDKILRDLNPYGEKWLSDLTSRQARLVFAVAFLEDLGSSTGDFMAFAGVTNNGNIERALTPALRGKEGLIERVGSHYRFRSRFARLWFVRQVTRVQALVPATRSPGAYARYSEHAFPDLPPADLRAEELP
jgi:hypothetical protein